MLYDAYMPKGSLPGKNCMTDRHDIKPAREVTTSFTPSPAFVPFQRHQQSLSASQAFVPFHTPAWSADMPSHPEKRTKTPYMGIQKPCRNLRDCAVAPRHVSNSPVEPSVTQGGRVAADSLVEPMSSCRTLGPPVASGPCSH